MRADPSLTRLLVGLAILSAIFFVAERLLGNGRGRPVMRRGFFTDATYWILTPLVAKPLIRTLLVLPIGLLVALGLASVEEFRARAYAGFGPLSRQPLWLQTIEIYLLVDFLGYWNHRLFHGGRWWPFHAVHHSSEDLDWMSSIRVHPVNELVGNLCRAVPVLFLGLNPLVTVSTAPVLTLYAVLLHANVNWDFGPLRGVIASPVFHRWHHSREPEAVDKNFAGLFPVWDILFATYYMPRDRVPVNFGIHEPMPAGYVRQLMHPFAVAFGRRGVGTLVMLAVASTLCSTAVAQPAVDSDAQKVRLTWVTPEIKAPGVSFHTFESAAAKATVSYRVYVPPASDRDRERRFPVVYWLHGSGGGLPGIPKVAAHFAAAIEAGKTPPCLVVFVNGMPNGMYVDWKDGSAPVETVIVRELVPHIDATYRTIATREGRILDGYSMGGYGAARLGFKYPELFRAISIMGGGPLQADLRDGPRAGRRRAEEVLERVYGGDPEYFTSVSPRVLAEQHAAAIKKGSLIRQVCGDADETFANNRDFHEHLERLGIPHTWTVLAGVDHDPLATLEALGDSNWEFYRAAIGGRPDTAAGNREPTTDRVLAF